MPSPILHVTAAYVFYRVARPWFAPAASGGSDTSRYLLPVAIGFSLLPDADSIVGVLAGDFGRYHNGATHSLFVGLGVGVAFGLVMQWRQRGSFLKWFLISALAYGFHVLMDALTIGRGPMALWPFSSERYLSPVALFYGVRWSDGLVSIRHLWTLATETGYVVVLGLMMTLLMRRRVKLES